MTPFRFVCWCRSQTTSSNPTDNEKAASFVDASIALVLSDCLHLCQSSKSWYMSGLSERIWGKKKKRTLPYWKKVPCLNPPGQGPYCAEPTCSPCAGVWVLQLPLTVQTSALRCEYLCESLLLYVSPAMSWWCSLPGGVQHYIIKQVFAHYKHVCLFRKLLWTILKRKLQ